MGHDHSHKIKIVSLNATYYIAIALNFGYVILETVMGLISNSMGLLSDAGHKMMDVFFLVIALVAFKLSHSKSNKKYTFGLKKSSILISLLNALLLFAAVCIIIWESIQKIGTPVEIDGGIISWTAGVGIVVSGVSAILLMKFQKKDINTRGAFLHMATDSLVSLGIVISGIVISFTGWSIIDPIISIGIALLILFNTCKLLAESFTMSVDGVPEDLPYDKVEKLIKSVEGVKEINTLHIWSVSVMETVLTAHITIEKEADYQLITSSIHSKLSQLGISEATIEIE